MLAAALRLHARLLPERSSSARHRGSGNRLCYGLIVCCQQAHGKKVIIALKWRYFIADSCLIFRLPVKLDIPKSVHDFHFSSDLRRNRWKRKHPEILTHSEALAASPVCVINAAPLSQSCHPRMPHWCGSGPAAPVVLHRTLIMTVGFTDQPKCVVLASTPAV